ncbi:MAG: radical SAM protein [Nitrospinota bacterium]|nr:radical SAM protein [Nitrospinota bacterium]
MELTNHCQLKCVTCPLHTPAGARMIKGFMAFEEFKVVVNQFAGTLTSLGLSGLGESLLHPDFQKMVTYIKARNNNLTIFLATNADLPKFRQILEPVIDKIDSIMISIDGVGDVFESVRLNSKYERFIENVEWLIAKRASEMQSTSFNMVVSAENQSQMKDVVLLAARLGIKYVGVNPMNLVCREENYESYNIYLTAEFAEHLKDARLEAAENGITLSADYFPDPLKPRIASDCVFLWDAFQINWDGSLAYCCAKPYPWVFESGNVFKSGLMKCVNSSTFIKARKVALKGATPPLCGKCSLVSTDIFDRLEVGQG